MRLLAALIAVTIVAAIGCGADPYPPPPSSGPMTINPATSQGGGAGGGAGGGTAGTGGGGGFFFNDAGGTPNFDAGFPPKGDGGFCFANGGFDSQPLIADGGLDMPLPVTGSTLTVSSSGYAVAVNPDAPSLSFIHIGTATSAADPSKNLNLTLTRGEWPFKPVVDSTGTAHVLLRGTAQLLSVHPSTPTNLRRVPLCSQPRGLLVDPTQSALHVACAEGEVLTLNAATGAVTARVSAPNDLRDLVLVNGRLYATRFRSAELFPVDAPLQRSKSPLAPGHLGAVAATVAWRTVSTPRGVAMLHQRSMVDPIMGACAGYGTGQASIILTGLTVFATDGGTDAGLPIDLSMHACAGGTLPVDLTTSADGTVYAFVEAGARRVTMTTPGAIFTGAPDAGPCGTGPSIQTGFRPLSAAFTADNRLVVQTEEPAVIVFGAYSKSNGFAVPGPAALKVALPGTAVSQTGHRLFHDTTAGNISCASCHPEGMDDGHVWTFKTLGPRRSQNLGGGIANTLPFHWDGDMQTFSVLMSEVMEQRMSGPKLDPARQSAMLEWIHSIPAQRAAAKDAAAAARGKLLFESASVGCSSCHSGPLFTNNLSVDVGTGGKLQVPTLVGLGTRAPFMHAGCARTLAERFTSCGGGDKHGTTSQLTSAQVADLVAYLETL